MRILNRYVYITQLLCRLKLLLELINLYECPESGRWALYIYSKIKNKKVEYKSY